MNENMEMNNELMETNDNEVMFYDMEPEETSSGAGGKLVMLGIGAGLGVAGKCIYDGISSSKFALNEDIELVQSGKMTEESFRSRHKLIGRAVLKKLDKTATGKENK